MSHFEKNFEEKLEKIDFAYQLLESLGIEELEKELSDVLNTIDASFRRPTIKEKVKVFSLLYKLRRQWGRYYKVMRKKGYDNPSFLHKDPGQ